MFWKLTVELSIIRVVGSPWTFRDLLNEADVVVVMAAVVTGDCGSRTPKTCTPLSTKHRLQL